MRTPLDALLTERSLHFLHVHRNQPILDSLSDEFLEAGNVPLKNVCAKVSQQLSDDIDEIVGLLNVSKRRFLEAAFIEAVQRAHTVMESEGVWDALERPEEPPPGSSGALLLPKLKLTPVPPDESAPASSKGGD